MAKASLTGCGAPCCKETQPNIGPVLLGREYEHFPDAVEKDGQWFLPAVDGFCSKLAADKTCTIYGGHPEACRKFSCQTQHACFEV